MLIYSQALDPLHCVVRLIAISERLEASQLTFDQIRLFDFYLVFPTCLLEAKLKAGGKAIKAQLKAIKSEYNHPADIPAAFMSSRPIVRETVAFLAANEIYDQASWEKSQAIVLNRSNVSIELKSIVDRYLERKKWIADFLFKEVGSIPFFGVNGLKHRSGLLEYRSDAI